MIRLKDKVIPGDNKMNENMRKFRVESDSVGSKNVPIEAYYGVQSLRASENFNITGRRMHKVNNITKLNMLFDLIVYCD